MEFEWDDAKDKANLRKHGIGFREASEVFRGRLLISEDVRRLYGERRWVALGEYDDEVIRVVYTQRGNAIRIITAWKANRNDRESYKKAQQDRPL